MSVTILIFFSIVNHNIYILPYSNNIMANPLNRQIIEFFRDRMKFAVLESILIVLSIILFTDELGYWVFTVFFAILGVLFYIGINLDYWTGKRLDEDEAFIYNHLQKMADDASASMQSI